MNLFKLTPEKYLQLFTEWPENEMVASGWDYKVGYFFSIIPYIIYTKKLFR